jgi:LuxR family quorum-sensing system transcriptional regulator SolR
VALKLLADAFEAMQGAKNSDQLRVEMERFTKEMGFERFTYALRIAAPSLTPQKFILSGYPDGWVERYTSRNYFEVDPVVLHCQQSSLPVVWDEHVPDHNGEAKSHEFWEEARSFGLKSGLSFVVHEQPGVSGIFSLARDRALDLEGQDLAALIGRAQVFASLLHHAVARIDLPRLVPQFVASLTARERECLKWAADGKTAWEIAQILDITERTVIFHINNVTQKLGAVNKTQAIVRALALKLL